MKSKNPKSLAGTLFFLLISLFSNAQSYGVFPSVQVISSNPTDFFAPGVYQFAAGYPGSNRVENETAVSVTNSTIFAFTISSANPTTCNGTDGSVTINGLTPGTSYDITYTDDGNAVGPITLVANGAGQATVTGLNAGVYAGFTVTENGNTTNLFSGVILSNPIFVPSFTAIPAFCAGSTAPVLPTTSNNGITGTWSPATVSNTTSGTYTFTPAAGQCGLPVTISITVTPRTTPTFSVATSICAGATAPILPATSNNGINGTWSPSTVDNTTSGSYTFTPNASACANPVTINITVNPVVTPIFAIGTTASICNGATAPTLPTTSTNGITGTWSPSTVSNSASGTYTFTPTAGHCATTTTFTVTVNPNITPTFSFGPTLTICNGDAVPALSTTSDNGITGTWSPATVSNTASGTYTFTPTAGQCATTQTFTVTVNPIITPSFSFGTTLTICDGGNVPALPATSVNGITGTWSPATVSNTTSGTYTFTPTAGQCATTRTFTVTVNPNITPTFSFGTTVNICSGATAPTLPTTSGNGITGTWSPATVSNTASGTYTFTPTAGQCATTATLSVTVNPVVTPAFAFGTSLIICNGGTVPVLSTTSDNGITGTWSPATVSNTVSGTYTFTPTAGQCATTTTFTVTVNPNITPTFSFGTTLTICNGGMVPALSTTSTNSITGTWSPATVSNTTSGTYTFTPTAGQCATTTTFTVTVNPNITPTFTFGTSVNICAGATAPTLPTTSTNGITGTWSPATVSNTASGTYTFTPTAGQCATTATLSVTVNPILTPAFAFGTSLTVCNGGVIPSLPTTSTNGITGTWSPATVSNTASGTYTFTPTAGQCATTTTFTVTVNPNSTPTFSFGTNLTICNGGTVPALPTTSTNGITGTWSPATVSTTASGTYTFTPTAGQCATTQTFSVTVNPNITPTFSFGTTLTICNGGVIPSLPTTSTNGITGTWSPATVSNSASGTYTFTPTAGLCATTTTFTVTVNPNSTPTFSFGTTLTICNGGTVPALSTTSTNGITGTWSPATVSNTASGTYTFTPTAGLCATTTTLTVTVNPVLTPTFSFGATASICANSTAPVLPTRSTNGINGTWSPVTVSNTASGTYTFTPNAGECGTTTTFTVTVNPNITPTFSFGTTLTICNGGVVPALSTTSTNSITGTWSPATVSNTASGTYTFTPTAGQCATTQTFTVTVNPILTPTFSFGTSASICIGSTVPALPTTSTNGVTGTWSPATVNNQADGVYTFTPTAGQCAVTATYTVQVNQLPVVTAPGNITVNDGTVIPATVFTTTPASGVSISWTNSNTAIGLAASGTGNVPQFTATNSGNTDITATITVTARINGCIGTPVTYTITVKALNKEVFVPNVFSPNGDGKNDVLRIYGNYINKVEMRIFNQWGQQVIFINNQSQGWDGTQKGKAQPVGVYVYVLRAVMTDGRTIDLKGSVTLVR